MDPFVYRDGELYCEEVPVRQIAEAAGTPTYIYSAAGFGDAYQGIATAFSELSPTICYSVKSCHNVHILRHLTRLGAAMDVVSGGELYRALAAGADPAKIVFAGVGKTDDEIRQAIDAGVGWFNIESEAELANVIRLAGEHKQTPRVALRVNPDVNPKTHRHTTTGKRGTKFGVDLERARRVFKEFGRNASVRLSGIHLHIGSPVYTVEPYVQAITKALGLIEELRTDGFAIDTLNIGGGYGASYETDQSPPPTEYARAIVPLLADKNLKVILEPGRSISANAGILLVRTLYIKQGGDKRFVIVDGAMTELIRPALYNAFHFAWPTRPGVQLTPPARRAKLELEGTIEVDIVGPMCEAGDFLARGRHLPPIQRGDLIAIFSAGAYGFAMASHYNSRPNAAEILVEGKTFRTIRRRETYADLIAAER